MKKMILIGFAGSLILLNSNPSWGTGSSGSTTYIEGNSGFSHSTPVVTSSSSGGFDLGNTVDFFNQKLDSLDAFVNSGISALGGEIGGLVDFILGSTSPLGNFLKDTAALGNLFNRIISLPAKASSWYAMAYDTVSGELDPCLRSPEYQTLPTYAFNEGWCIGSGTVATQSNGTYGWSGQSLGAESGASGVYSLGEIFSENRGALGVPDPTKVRVAIGSKINEPHARGNLWGLNTHIERRYGIQQGDQALASERGTMLTSTAMQKQVESTQDSLAATATEALKSASSGQALTSTQDVVKANLEMQAQQSMIMTSIATEQLSQKVDTGLTHLQLSNISKELDRQTHQEINKQMVAIGRLTDSLSKVRLK